MVKPPKIRHSKSRQQPVTIELEPGEVSRIEEPQAADRGCLAECRGRPRRAVADGGRRRAAAVGEAAAR